MKNTTLETFDLPKPQSSITTHMKTHYLPTKRLTVQVDRELGDKIQDYAYYEGLTQQEILLQALEEFLSNNPTSTEEIRFKKALEYIARKMLAKGYKKDEIQEMTDLSIQQIENLN